jgi:hypothetical protein
VIVAALIGGMVVLGGAPFGIENASPAAAIATTVLTTLPFVCLALLKGKLKLSVVGLFVPPVAWLAARLAKPLALGTLAVPPRRQEAGPRRRSPRAPPGTPQSRARSRHGRPVGTRADRSATAATSGPLVGCGD